MLCLYYKSLRFIERIAFSFILFFSFCLAVKAWKETPDFCIIGTGRYPGILSSNLRKKFKVRLLISKSHFLRGNWYRSPYTSRYQNEIDLMSLPCDKGEENEVFMIKKKELFVIFSQKGKIYAKNVILVEASPFLWREDVYIFDSFIQPIEFI